MFCDGHSLSDGENFETVFVGREECLQYLTNAWNVFRIIGVFGLKGMGKSRTVKELIRRKLFAFRTLENLNEGGAIEDIVLDLTHVSEQETLCNKLCSALKCDLNRKERETNSWINRVCEHLSDKLDRLYVILFDNAENVIDSPTGQELLKLVTSHLSMLTNVKIFITSTTQIDLDQCCESFLKFELEPLHPTEVSTLLDLVAPHVKFGDYKDTIIKLCEGLPLIILMVGCELSEDDRLIDVHEMIELLSDCRLKALSREFYPPEDRIGTVYKAFIERLTATFRNRLAVLQYIPGSFDVEQATEMLDTESDKRPDSTAEDESVRELRHRNYLSYNPSNRRYNIQGIIRECLEVYFVIKNLSDNQKWIFNTKGQHSVKTEIVRKRYCKLFSVVLEKLCNNFYSTEYAQAVSLFMLEQPNLQKLFIEVYNSKEDTYQYFMQVAASCTEFIDKFLTTESEKFYNGCLFLASSYGKNRDIATVYIALGSMYTNAKGEYAAGEENYRNALRHIENDGTTILNATVYQRLGWNLYKRGNYTQAYKCLTNAFEAEKTLKMFSASLYRHTLNSLGLVCADLGLFSEARLYLQENQRCCKVIGNRHWSLGCNYDNFGTLYELKGDDETAMEYYQKALDIKLSTTATNLSIVISQTNIANIYLKLNDTSNAVEFADLAMTKVHEPKCPNKEALSLAYNTMGKVCIASGDFRKATEMLEKVVEIRQKNSPGSEFHIESLILLASAKCKLNEFSGAVRTLQTVLDFRERFNRTYPSKFHIAECLENMCGVYETKGDHDKLVTTLQELQAELIRLERVFMCTSDEMRKRTIDIKLQYLKQTLSNLDS